ncbi:MAG TPA: sugar phosphate isomerase/epimerase family protein [Kofleriaceae bacterium]|nr:sugar phosphate isomerase/epimerase family protein [Kofleriaceae bacterium]
MGSTSTSQAPGGPRISIRRLCGVGDEAGHTLDAQIAAQQALGWSQLELRSIDGARIEALADEEMGRIADRLAAAGLGVPVLASTIGDWSSTIAADFADDLAKLSRLLPFARRLRAPFVRIMSYPAGDASDGDWRTEVRRRVTELARRAADQGVTLLHENCHGWAASDPERALALLEATRGRGLRLLFDIGNPVAHGYDGRTYLVRVLPWVAHVHVKDVIPPRATGEPTFTLPGEGEARVLECVDLVLGAGYAGAVSIEPHVAARIHEGARATDEVLAEAYLAHGRRLMALLGERLLRDDEVTR